MGGYTKIILAQTLGQIEDIKSMNEAKIEEARGMYWDACKYPRKKKKAMRKQAIKDYILWSELSEIYNNIFS